MLASDTSHGPVLNVNRSKLQTYLIQIIDDASRLVVGSKFFFNDNAFNFQCVLKEAITIYGVPRKLFLDNGKPYKNHQLRLICANIGTELLYARPYSPESKRKIERSFRTIKDSFINCTDWNDFTTIEELNEKFKEYLNSSYQNEVHSSLGMSPNKRYMKDINRIKTIEDKKFLTECFYHTDEKRVSTDCTITLNKIRFEVPPEYLKQKILIKYLPTDNSCAYIVNPNNKTWKKIFPVDKVANSKRKRQSLSYDKKREDLTNV